MPTVVELGAAVFVTARSIDLRVFEIVQTMAAPAGTLTVRGPLPVPLATLVVPLRHEMLEVYSPKLVPVPAVSPTVWLPTLTVFAPVVPPLPTLAACVVLSIWRLNFPASFAGASDLVTVSVPGFRVFVIVQTTSAP